MGLAVKGKDKRIKVDDGTGTLVEVPYQGDSTYNTGVTPSISGSKNGKHPFQEEAGHSVTFSIEPERPALAIHTRISALAAAGEQIDCEYGDVNSGGIYLSGSGLLTAGEEAANTDGIIVQQYTLSFVDDPVPGTRA